MSIPSLIVPACLLWLIAIAVMDLRIRKVRNWMVLIGLSTGFAVIAVGVQPFQVSFREGVIGMLAAFAALLPFYALRWMGAGDVKFAAVMGLWFGLSPNLLLIWMGGSLLAGVHGLLVLLWRKLQWSPSMVWVHARLPLHVTTALAAPARAEPPSSCGTRQIQRSVPYAGYMALMVIWILLGR